MHQGKQKCDVGRQIDRKGTTETHMEGGGAKEVRKREIIKSKEKKKERGDGGGGSRGTRGIGGESKVKTTGRFRNSFQHAAFAPCVLLSTGTYQSKPVSVSDGPGSNRCPGSRAESGGPHVQASRSRER